MRSPNPNETASTRLPFSRTLPRTVLAASFVALMSATAAQAQQHSRDFGPYIVRSSTVVSKNLSAEAARAHGIERDARRAILNVTVLKKEGNLAETVPAPVQSYAENLSGHKREIDMRPVPAEGCLSYMGTYEFVNGELLDFHITAKPENSGLS